MKSYEQQAKAEVSTKKKKKKKIMSQYCMSKSYVRDTERGILYTLCIICISNTWYGASQVARVVNNPAASAEDISDYMGLILGFERSLGEEHGNPLQ